MEMLLLSVLGPVLRCAWQLDSSQVALITTVRLILDIVVPFAAFSNVHICWALLVAHIIFSSVTFNASRGFD